MRNDTMEMNTFARNWWMFALRGVLAIIFGIMIIAWPAIALQTLVLLFGAYVLVDGIFAIVHAFSHREYRHWWVTLLEGIVGIIAGLLTFFMPGITALSLVLVIGAYALVTGILEIVAAIQMRHHIDHEWALAFAGIASVLFGIIVLVSPGTGALAILAMIAAYSIFFGVLMLILAFRMRSWQPDATRTTTPLQGVGRL